MSFSFSAWIRLGAIGVSVFVAACEGDSGSNVTDGGFDRPPQADALKPDTGAPPVFGDGGTQAEAPPPKPPPEISSSGAKLLGDGWEMLGTHGTGCSNGPTSRMPGAERWCAVSRTGTRLGARELWVINVTKAAAAPGTVKCDGTSTDCVKLSDELFSARPNDGPRYPGSHRFNGETLIFYASPTSAPGELFRGTVYAWQAGWPAAKAITGNNATICSAHPRVALAWCIVNVQGLAQGEVLRWDEHVGATADGVMPKMATVYPRHPTTEASQADSLFTIAGDYYVWSTPASGNAMPGSRTGGPPESLYYVRTADIKAGVAPTPIKVGDDIANFTVSPDGTKYFYMKDYNYNTVGQPSGTLWMADFPTGANPVALAGPKIPSGSTAGVASFQLLVDQDMMGKKIGFIDSVAAGKGDYKILNDPANLDSVTNVISGTLGLPLSSGNLLYSYFATERAEDIATTNSRVTKNDGSSPGCTLTNSTRSALFGFPFTKSASLVFWMDNYDQATDSGQGWVANTDCSSKRMYTSNIDYWFVHNDEALLYSDDGDGQTATLRYSTITNLNTLGTGQIIQKQIERTFWILPNYEAVLYGIRSTSAAVNGIYFAKLPPMPGTPPVDAGAGADAAPDAAAVD